MNSRLVVVRIALCLALGVIGAFVARSSIAQDGGARKADGPAPAAKGAPPADAAKKGGDGKRANRPPASEAEMAEMAKLNDLPPYSAGLPEGDYSVGPEYTPAAEETPREGVPQGKVVSFTMDSSESKIFPGLNGAIQRNVFVYVPAQYVPGTPAPFIVSCDAWGNNRRQLPTILDNMIHDRRLPVMCAVMIANGGRDNRSYEYDTVDGKYAEFVETEVLPRAEKETGVTFTKDPDARMTYGGSSGGICAFTMAWFHPEWYHRVLSYSGTFVNLKNSPDAPHGGWEYHENFIAKTPNKPIRTWLHVGERDNGATSAGSGMRNWVLANQRMAAALKAKGYPYQFVYAKNSGHTTAAAISATLPQALEYVWRGYPIEPAKK